MLVALHIESPSRVNLSCVRPKKRLRCSVLEQRGALRLLISLVIARIMRHRHIMLTGMEDFKVKTTASTLPLAVAKRSGYVTHAYPIPIHCPILHIHPPIDMD